MKNKFIYITLALFVIALMYKPIKTEGAILYGWGINTGGQKVYFYETSSIYSSIPFNVYSGYIMSARPISFYQVSEIGSTTPIPNTSSAGYLNLSIMINGNGCVVNGSFNGYFNSLDSYIDSITPKWYEIVWDKFIDSIGATGSGIADFFTNLIDSIFGEDNQGGPISHAVTIRNPTLAPTPTPIPYSTVVIPKTDIVTGETVYETNYYYVNPSGTPVVTSSPPTNSPASGGSGVGSTEYNPINGDPYSLPYLDWLSNVDIGENDYNGIDSIGDGMTVIDDVGSEYTDGMSAVQDSTGTLPTSWLMLIGIAAAIPLLAGIISRFLGG